MNKTARGSILVLDDDAGFRSLLVNLLRPHGFKVVEASSPDEAFSLFSKKDTVLAIVDYRLPQMDGMSWITKLREAGANVPVVFCSAIPCDAKTFSWLRNILQVAMIVQKPIVPSAFLQQIESLLPSYVRDFSSEGIAGVDEVYTADDADLQADASMREQISQLDKKVKVAQALQNARQEYFIQLDNDWKVLTAKIEQRNHNAGDEAALAEAIRITHSIRGTAGSLGLEEIGKLAGQMEDFLLSLDPWDSTDQEIYWSEIIRAAAKGSELIKDAMKEAKLVKPSTVRNRVLILSSNQNIIEAAQEDETKEFAHVQGTDNAAAFMRYAAENRLDAVIIDTAPDTAGAFRDAEKLRSITGNESIPIGCICLNNQSLSASDLLYLGASEKIIQPVSGESLREAIKRLLEVRIPGQPRILVVDDDEVLCKFVCGILNDQRMDASYETNPTLVVETMEKIQPDLVLLDLMMPVVTGYEVCRQIRADKKWSDVPVLFLTSKTGQAARSAAFAVGANDFLTKPVLAEELQARVAAQLAMASRKRKERARDPESGMLRGEAYMAEAADLLLAHQKEGRPLAIALIEIDDFDELTIVQGHHGAQSVARALSLMIHARFTAETLRCRWSSSGFALAAPGADSATLAGAVARLLSDFTRLKFSGSSHKFAATFSAGIADSFQDGVELEEIIKGAHHRLRTGRREKVGVISS